MNRNRVLFIIVLSQFCCTSLWFATNGILTQLTDHFDLFPSSLAHLTSAVQLGFISGTFVFALTNIADRFSPSKVFFVCGLIAASANLVTIWSGHGLLSLIGLRFAVGFFLAGIYPVGMKITSDYFKSGLGNSLGLLVGALVLGTASPHLISYFNASFDWENVIYVTSTLASMGALLVGFFISDGPYRTHGQKLMLNAAIHVFADRKFRAAALGYFGHMWELYTFWAFVPILIVGDNSTNNTPIDVSFWAFTIIGIGALSCLGAGYLSGKLGEWRIARTSLVVSGSCCLLYPLFFQANQPIIFIGFLLVWGAFVIADSPMFSTLVANNAAPEWKGTGLTIVNCIGFAITIISLQFAQLALETISINYFLMILAIGPMIGLFSLRSMATSQQRNTV